MHTDEITAPPRNLLYSGKDNKKLGPGIWHLSIPAIDTCPGKTALCGGEHGVCYVIRIKQMYPDVEAAYELAYQFSMMKEFATTMVHFIKGNWIRVVRIHVSGDFYSAEYTRKWLSIARVCKGTTFYAYTRSWRVKEILPVLKQLAALPNVQLWWSEDRETGRSPQVKGVKVAFMVVNDADEELIDPARHDLVFRDKRHRVKTRGYQLKRVNDVLVCPAEQWQARTSHPEIQCSQCKICFRDKLRRKP